MFSLLLPTMADATSSALLGINYAASATTISNECARVARTRQVDVPSPPRATSRMLDSVLRRRAAYASATLVTPPPLPLLLLSLPPLFAASADVAAAATGCICSCRSCGDGVDMASSACRLRERGASAPCRRGAEAGAMFSLLLPTMADATSSALLGINYAASATTISNECARVARTRQMLDSVLRRRAAYASATLVTPPPLPLLLLSLPPLFAASADVAAAATGCICSCRSCGDGVDMASSACRLRERGASAPCR
uniref:Uncharacterized protein n=1 Tax=Oryza barthii TaxID=65489 RepID=A0A0D3FYW6_9ORYZ